MVDLTLGPAELAATIEALHDAILRRVRWTTVEHDQFQTWRSLELETVQAVLDNLVSAYTKAIMLYRESDFAKSQSFESTFLLKPEVWELLNDVTVATTWTDVPTHPVHSYADRCPVCGSIAGIA